MQLLLLLFLICTTAFWLDKASGKKCFLLSSKLLRIPYRAKRLDWCKWTAAKASVFPEVLEWVEGFELDLRGTTNLADLSPNTLYVVRFIVGFPSQKHVWKGRLDLSLQVMGQDKQEQTVSISPNQEGNGLQSSTEFDGWKHVEVGEFYSGNRDGGKVEFRMHQMEALELKFNKNGTVEFVEVAQTKWRISFTPDEEMKVPMGGLLVMGVEIRPSSTGSFDPNSGELNQSFAESARISEVSASNDSLVSDGSSTLSTCFGGRRV
ncbi:hypothetical protein ACLOJK_007980 [Asimina triloba]